MSDHDEFHERIRCSRDDPDMLRHLVDYAAKKAPNQHKSYWRNRMVGTLELLIRDWHPTETPTPEDALGVINRRGGIEDCYEANLRRKG
jgi:hypothetical protein